MRARQLEVFTAVMRAGTVTEAARMLDISQPALSQVLRHTEDELGFALFDREKGRLQPTPEALELYPEAERLFGELEGLRRKTVDLRQGRAGLVRVGCSIPPAMSLLPRALVAFRARHPGITLRCNVARRSSLEQMLREGDVAMAVALTESGSEGLEAEALGQTGFCCLLPEGHALAAEPQLGLAALAETYLVSYRAGTRPRAVLDEAARRAGLPFEPRLEIDTSISAVGFVQAGLGVAVVDALLPWGQFEGMVQRPLAGVPPLTVSILTLRERALSAAEALLRDEIRAQFRAGLADLED